MPGFWHRGASNGVTSAGARRHVRTFAPSRDNPLVRRKSLLVAAVLLVMAAGAQAIRMHAQDGRWALIPQATPERLHFAGRDYDRGRRVAERAGLVKDGTTSGGGTIDTIRADHGTEVVIYARDSNHLWEYSLERGP